MSLESNKTLGGIGAILLAIPFLSLIGIILVLIAMKGMAENYNDDEIFKNAMYGFLFGIIGVIALVGVILLLSFGYAATTTIVTPFAGFGLIVTTFAILYIFSLISAIFYKKSLNILAEKSGEQLFNTAGTILLVAAAIPVLGEVLKVIAWIIVAVGFFNIKESTQQPSVMATVSSSVDPKFCKYCGKPIESDTVFCPECGKKIA